MTGGKRVPLTARLAQRRVWIQIAFLAVWLDPLGIRLHALCGPVFHCHSCPLATFACPIGVLAHFAAMHVVPFVVLGALAATGAMLGTLVCGWACPFGLVQDLIGRIPLRKYELPSGLGYLRYVVLGALVLLIPYWFGEESRLFFCRLCPAGAMEGALPFTVRSAVSGQGLVWPSAAKMIVFLLILSAMFFTWRPWCALFCPLGAMFSLCNRFSFFFLRFHPQECNDCDRCRSLCRYRGPAERRGGDMRCIRCLECTRCSGVTLSTAFISAPAAGSRLAAAAQGKGRVEG